MTLSEAIVIRLKSVMEEKDFSAYKLHCEGGISKSTLSQVLNGTREKIKVYTLYEVIATMGVTLGDFFSDPIFEDLID